MKRHQLKPRGDQVFIHRNRTVLGAAHDGFIRPEQKAGLFVHETRVLSCHRYLVAGAPVESVASARVSSDRWLGYYAIPPHVANGKPKAAGKPPQHLVELKVTRVVGDGLHEDLDLVNYTQRRVKFVLTLELDADFADVSDVEAQQRMYEPSISRHFEPERGDGIAALIFDARAENRYQHQGDEGTARVHRRSTLRFSECSSPARYDDGKVHFEIELRPHETWHACLELEAEIESLRLDPPLAGHATAPKHTDWDVRRQSYFHYSTGISAPGPGGLTDVVLATAERAKEDLVDLRLYDLDEAERAWTLSAGVPIFMSLFGRDTLTAAWQAALVSPDLMRGTLRLLPKWQGTRTDDWREEKPGRMLHQARTGPLSKLETLPWSRHYGSLTTSAFYPVALAEAWHWTGDRGLVEPLLEPALRALEYVDRYADMDGDGFYEYLGRSERPQRNQGWKDSDEAIVHADGSRAEPPIATCEAQGFVYLAKLLMGEMLWWFGQKRESVRLFKQVAELKKRFNETFWMPDEGYYALGLDKDKQLIRSITSNPGHCLATGIVEEGRVEQVVARMFSAELFSGWGVRTLSTTNPAYNPYAYQRGNIWPVEHGTFALALRRYGLTRHLQVLSKAQFEAAALFDEYRLPECFGGHTRDAAHPFPALYMEANSPQAWSASGVFCLLQAMLGVYPYAPLNMLLVDPELPEWLPELTLERLQVGDAQVSLRFWRKDRNHTGFEILDQKGTLQVVRQPSPWSLTTSAPERVKKLLESLLK
jgi:glycogen debranching enzyme